MFHPHSTRRGVRVGALGAALLFGTTLANGQPPRAGDKRACGLAYKNAQEREQSGRLREARDFALACTVATCGAVVRRACLALDEQLRSDTPSVVLLVTDEDGAPRTDVRVTVDGELLTSRLDGRSLPLDPGVHEFTFSIDGAVVSTQKVMIAQGQHNRPISVELHRPMKAATGPSPIASPAAAPVETKSSIASPAAAPVETKSAGEGTAGKPKSEESKSGGSIAGEPAADAPETRSVEPVSNGGRSAAPYLVGAAGLAGLGGYALLVYWGRKDNESLAQCSPNCPPSSVDHIRRLYLAADVSFGVGVAALVTSAVLFATSGTPAKDSAQRRSRYSWDVRPARSGAYATVSGWF